MAYATIEDLEKVYLAEKLEGFVDDEGDGSEVENRLNEALTDGSNMMDVYFKDRYSLPFSTPYPPILKKLCVDIAAYNVYTRVKDDIPENPRKRYEDAISTLEDIRDGKLDVLEDSGEEAENSGGAVEFYAI